MKSFANFLSRTCPTIGNPVTLEVRGQYVLIMVGGKALLPCIVQSRLISVLNVLDDNKKVYMCGDSQELRKVYCRADSGDDKILMSSVNNILLF